MSGTISEGGERLSSPLTKSVPLIPCCRRGITGNQRWRWGDQRLFRMI